MPEYPPSQPTRGDRDDPVTAMPSSRPTDGRRGAQIRTLMLAALAAVVLAVVAIVPAVAGIATWKIVLGLVGLVLFIMGGRSTTR